jgi:hypothetical protein
MFAVPDLASLRLAWVRIRDEQFVLYGFLLYSDLDTTLLEYVRLAFSELDYLAGLDCAIFVIEEPSLSWIETARRKNHPWFRVFGRFVSRGSASVQDSSQQRQFESVTRENPDENEKDALLARLISFLLRDPGSYAFQLSAGETVGARHLVSPNYQLPYDRSEIWEVARLFGIKSDEVPCLVLFHDLEAGKIWKLDLSEIKSVDQANKCFRKAFASERYRKILDDARHIRHAAAS